MPAPQSTGPRQTKEDREYIIANLPEGTRRVQVITAQGTQQYKRPEEVDTDHDEIVLAKDGTPVVMRGKPGRKPKAPQLNPVTPQIGVVVQARDDHFENNPLLKGLKKNPAAEGVMDEVLKGMAEEAAAIEFDRLEAQRHGQEGANFAAKRARVLKAMGDLVLKRQQISEGGLVDLESPQFSALFSLLLETFKNSMKEAGCRSEQIEQAFTHLVGSLDENWKQEAKARMREKRQ